MLKSIKTLNVVVEDYDAAVEFYTKKLGFVVHQYFPEQNWVVLSLPDKSKPMIALCKADDESRSVVGNQTGRYGMFILMVDNCQAEYERMKGEGVEFALEPQASQHGTHALAKDLYGNKIFMSDSKFFEG